MTRYKQLKELRDEFLSRYRDLVLKTDGYDPIKQFPFSSTPEFRRYERRKFHEWLNLLFWGSYGETLWNPISKVPENPIYKQLKMLGIETKTCSRCKQTLPIERFAIDKTRLLPLQRYCMECAAKYQRLRRIP
jgi:hypothetical protein